MNDFSKNIILDFKEYNYIVDAQIKKENVFYKENVLLLFNNANSQEIIHFLYLLLDVRVNKGRVDGNMCFSRIMSLVCLVVRSLVELRDRGKISLNMNTLQKYFILSEIQDLLKNGQLSDKSNNALKAYLTSLPGYVEGQPKQSETTAEQHGYLQMFISKVITDIELFLISENKLLVITEY